MALEWQILLADDHGGELYGERGGERGGVHGEERGGVCGGERDVTARDPMAGPI